MPTLLNEEVDLKSVITFRSKNAVDTVLWRGTLIGVGIYESIRSIMDPRSYNEAVRQVDPDVPSDATLLNYFTIIVDNGASSPTVMVFAEEWLEPGSLTVISLANKVKIQVEDPFNNSTQILSILANAGYSCKILP